MNKQTTGKRLDREPCSNLPLVRRFLPLLLVLSPVLSAQEPPLTIERAVEFALTRNERAEVADTTVEAAEARLRRARSFFFPRVDVTGLYRHQSDADTRNLFSSVANLTQTVFDARAFPALRQVRFERDATRLTASESKRVLAFDAAAAFLTTLSFEQVMLAAEHRRTFARTSLEDARARFDAGLVSSNDVTRAELEMATAERAVTQARGSVESARLELSNLLNAEIRGPLAAPAELLDAADDRPPVDEPFIVEAQKKRDDIEAERLRVAALREFAREPALRFIPSLAVNAQARSENDGPISNRDQDGFVGMTLNWSVFDGGVRAAESAERAAIVRGAELELERSLRDVERDIRTFSVQMTTEQASLREAAAALRAASKNADETNELYRQGLASALELADATQRLFEAEVAEVTARYRMALAFLALREASGGGPLEE